MMEAVNQFEKMGKAKDKKKKFKNFKGPKVDLKQVFKRKNLKKVDAEELSMILAANMGQFDKEIRKYYKNNSKVIKDMEEAIDLFCNKKVVKAFVIMDENNVEIPDTVFTLLSDIYLTGNSDFLEKKVCKKYLEVFYNHKKDEIKDIAKKLDVKKMKALQIVFGATHFKGCHIKMLGRKILFVQETLLTIDKDVKKKTIYKLFKSLIGINRSINTLMGDKRSKYNEIEDDKKEIYDMVSEMVLETLNKMDSDDRKEILKRYLRMREKNVNFKRRFNLNKIDEEKYSKLAKTINSLKNRGFRTELFD